MSLFASAFESGNTAGPSTLFPTSHSGKTAQKRKRPSGAGDENDGQLRSAQQNLERLMKNIDGGDGGKSLNAKEGREGMGMQPKKKKNKGKAERLQAKEKELGVSLKQNKEPKRPKEQRMAEQAMKSPRGRDQASGTPNGKKEKKSKAHAVEIPVPASPAVKEEETSGLTSLQKGMKSKLEGARFRSVKQRNGLFLADGQMDQRAAVLYTVHRSCCDDEEGPEDLCRCKCITHPLRNILMSSTTRHTARKLQHGPNPLFHTLSTVSTRYQRVPSSSTWDAVTRDSLELWYLKARLS